MVVVAMGVSGAGKTTFGRALSARLGWSFEDADDWHAASSLAKLRRGEPLGDDDRRPWLEALNRALREWIAHGRGVVLACSALRRSYREILRSGISDPRALRFVFLDGTYDEIERRLRLRTGHLMPESLLRSQFDTLEPPDAAEALRIEATQPTDGAVDAVVRAFQLMAASPPR